MAESSRRPWLLSFRFHCFLRSRTATEEIFGPVVTIHTFKDEEDALRQVNQTRYGMGL